MLDAAKKALTFSAGLNFEDFKADELKQSAIIRQIEIIGEAASKVSKEAKKANPGIPWREIVGMRNRLIHHYFGVDVKLVWEALQKDLPQLVEQIKDMLSKR